MLLELILILKRMILSSVGSDTCAFNSLDDVLAPLAVRGMSSSAFCALTPSCTASKSRLIGQHMHNLLEAVAPLISELSPPESGLPQVTIDPSAIIGKYFTSLEPAGAF